MRIITISQAGQVETEYIANSETDFVCKVEGNTVCHRLTDSFRLISAADQAKPMNSKAMVLLHLMTNCTAQQVRGNAFIAQVEGGIFTNISKEAEELLKGLLLGGECR